MKTSPLSFGNYVFLERVAREPQTFRASSFETDLQKRGFIAIVELGIQNIERVYTATQAGVAHLKTHKRPDIPKQKSYKVVELFINGAGI